MTIDELRISLQFAYQLHVGVEDAIIYMLQMAHSSMDSSNSMVQMMFFNFSSSSKTIQPRLLKDEL